MKAQLLAYAQEIEDAMKWNIAFIVDSGTANDRKWDARKCLIDFQSEVIAKMRGIAKVETA